MPSALCRCRSGSKQSSNHYILLGGACCCFRHCQSCQIPRHLQRISLRMRSWATRTTWLLLNSTKVCDELATLEDQHRVEDPLRGVAASSLGADLIVLVAVVWTAFSICCCWSLLYSCILRSRGDSLPLHVILQFSIYFPVSSPA